MAPFSSPEPLGLICNPPVSLPRDLPRDQETTGSGDENGVALDSLRDSRTGKPTASLLSGTSTAHSLFVF